METCDYCKKEIEEFYCCEDCADVVCKDCANFVDGTAYCNDCYAAYLEP